MTLILPNLQKLFVKQHYGLVGNHSAVKVCEWLKKSLRDKGYCYKQQFYGIESHRCLQMTPAVAWCTQKCLFCWRPIEHTLPITKLSDEPKEIVRVSIEMQRRLINGFAGTPETLNKKKFKEAQNPKHVAISLAGEPTIYPRIGELIAEYHKNRFSSFLVTNGTLPKRLANLDELPTQLYVSVDAPSREVYTKLMNPILPNSWEKLNETLSLLPSLDTKIAIRITLVNKINNSNPEKYAKLLAMAEPDYIECKSYMHIGYSRKRLKRENMCSFAQVNKFASELAKELSYNVRDFKADSRVVLLAKTATKTSKVE